MSCDSLFNTFLFNFIFKRNRGINFPPQSKVPGHVHKVKEHALEKDLTKLSTRELLDLKARQEDQLNRKSRLLKLPDKGEKLQLLYERTVKALEMKNEIDSASRLLASLNLETKDINNLEWRGKASKDILDSDDDEDPIAILATSNSVSRNQRIVRHEEDDTQLITEEDLKEAEEIVSGVLLLDPVLEHVVENENMDQSKRFLPHKPKYKDPSTVECKKKIRDNSAATPPAQDHGAQLISLRESIEIENKYRLNMKDLQEKQAAERLAAKMKELGRDDQKDVPLVTPKDSEVDRTQFRRYRRPSMRNSITDDDYDPEDFEFSDDDD